MATENPNLQKQVFEAHLLEEQNTNEDREPSKMLSRTQLFEVIWILKGKGTCRVDMQEFTITDNMLYCLLPGQLHILQADDEINGYRIAFSSDFMSPDFGIPGSRFSPEHWGSERAVAIVRVDDLLHAAIQKLVAGMIWELNNDLNQKFTIIRGLLTVFMAYLSNQLEISAGATKPQYAPPVFENFILLVEKKFSIYKLVNQYADHLAVTPNYLSEVVKRSSGISASDFIHRRVILEAKRMALASNISMKEIAFQIGFEDPCQFSKFFKLKTGSTFSEFRKTLNDNFSKQGIQ